MNGRYAEIATLLSNEQDASRNKSPDAYQMARYWTAHNDARNYAILGDPAVRLPLTDRAKADPRPAIADVRTFPGPELPAHLVPVIAETGPSPAPVTGSVSGLIAADDRKIVAEFSATGDVLRGISDAVSGLTGRLAEFLKDVTTLEVATYVSDSIEKVGYDHSTGAFTGGARYGF